MDSGPRPDQEVADQDLVEAIQEQFSEDELEILTLWLDEMPWADIGAETRVLRPTRHGFD